MNPLARGLIVTLALATPARAIDIATCNSFVPLGQVGVLQTDLVCPGVAGVLVGVRATLVMNGHSITGGSLGIQCAARRCTIEGPGEITGVSGCAIQAQPNVGPLRIGVTGVDIYNNEHGICSGSSSRVRVRLADVTIRNNTNFGISSSPGAATGPGTVVGRNIVVSDNGSFGILGRRIRLFGSLIENNTGIGVLSRVGRATLRESTVIGNDSVNGFDVATHKRPHARASTCGRSAVISDFAGFPDPAAASWGVCAGD